jgi:peroxiredoxin
MRYFKVILLLLLFAALTGSAQMKTFTINGSLKNMAVMPKRIYLNYAAFTGKAADSATVKDGNYSFQGAIDASSPALMTLVKGESKKPGNGQYLLMLDNGIINIVSDGAIGNATVTGSGATANEEFHQVTSYALKESAAINKIVESNAYKTSDSLKKVIQQRSSSLLGNSLVNMISYVRENPASAISPFLTYSLLATGFLTPEMTATLNQNFPAAMRSTTLGLALDSIANTRKEAIAEALLKRKASEDLIQLGSKAKEFTQNDINGRPVSLDSYKGKYVLIDFWASWCRPCRAENPNVVKAYHRYKDKGFTVLGVSLDGTSQKGKWIEAIEKDGLSWTQVSDLKGGNNEVALLYGVVSIPQNFLLDPSGVVIAKNLRGADLDKTLAALFK